MLPAEQPGRVELENELDRSSVPTTPPPPVDIEELFPELRDYATTATRLHPRRGNPGTQDSSIGGPLRWPADEPWPFCVDREHYVNHLSTPATVRRQRRIYAAAKARAAATGQPYELTEAERAELPASDHSEPEALADGPIALVPVAQLYRRDVPDFAGPADCDLLQVLWCPLDHPETGYNPRVEVRWRRVAEITGQVAEVPEPAVVYDDYLPTACVVHPEPVREHQYGGLLPEDLDRRLSDWEEESDVNYQVDLSLAPGWKVGGFANWSLTDWHPVDCTVCGTAMTLLLTADSSEYGGSDVWRAVGEPAGAPVNPVGVTIGRGYSLYIFVCPTSFDHPPATAMQ
ncbi:hypothetical protein [Polymorphospora rubra]|uniref:hypothetical protein n=1 Tax=Polymorphospora rubra TaxID=338584 RepID=UPI001BB32E86|nr:hypothetical protein [Polymorphospora rubra]